MFGKKTVFIVGAGASNEVGLPIGDQLKTRISDTLRVVSLRDGFANPESGIHETIQLIRHQNPIYDSIKPFIRAGMTISNAMPLAISIDNFLHSHFSDDYIVKVGKLAIAINILEAERNSTIFCSPMEYETIDFRSLKESWHTAFCKILTEGVQRDDIDGIFDNVSIVTFNYDRCIEHYICHALCTYYRITISEAQKLVSRLAIFHPYGQVGRLNWQAHGGLSFGLKLNSENLIAASQQVRTFTERVEDDGMLDAIHTLIAESELIVCLGFSFGKMNMQLLDSTTVGARKEVIATTLGISERNKDAIRDLIASSLGARGQTAMDITLANLACTPLVYDYGRVISS